MREVYLLSGLGADQRVFDLVLMQIKETRRVTESWDWENGK